MPLTSRGALHRLRLPAVALLVLSLVTTSAHAQLYRWTDENGETHFGQGQESVPERYRKGARSVGTVDPPPAPSGPAEATVNEGVTRIAFAPGHPIMVTARINGRGLVQLLLDTGADRTTMSPTALMGLGVSARVAPLRVYSHDAQMGGGAAGLLGRDFLNYFRVTIDNVRGVVEIAPR